MTDVRHLTAKCKHAMAVALLAPAGAALLAAACGSAYAAAGETLAQVTSRGAVRCGVSEGITGFSARDAAGRSSGLACRGEKESNWLPRLFGVVW